MSKYRIAERVYRNGTKVFDIEKLVPQTIEVGRMLDAPPEYKTFMQGGFPLRFDSLPQAKKQVKALLDYEVVETKYHEAS